MSRIRSAGTTPEVRLGSLVKELVGKRRVVRHARFLEGVPDLVIPSLKVAIFCDGCFYHACPRHGHIPKSNVEYWEPKLARNCRRDRANRAALRAKGYAVWRVWEHDLKPSKLEITTVRLIGYLKRRRKLLR